MELGSKEGLRRRSYYSGSIGIDLVTVSSTINYSLIRPRE